MPLSTPTVIATLASATDLIPYSSSSGSPSANALLIAFVDGQRSASNVETPTVVGTPWGLTWARVAALDRAWTTGGATNRAGFVFVAQTVAAPGSATFDITFVNTHIGCEIIVVQYLGADLSAGAAAALVQTNVNSGTGTSFTTTLSAASHADNHALAFWAMNTNVATITPEGGWNEISDINHAAPTIDAEACWINPLDTSPSAASSTASSQVWGGWAMEVKAGQQRFPTKRRSMTPQIRAGVW